MSLSFHLQRFCTHPTVQYVTLFLGVWSIDQYTKYLFSDQIILNTGISFGLGQSIAGLHFGLLFLTLVLGILSWRWTKGKKTWIWLHAVFFGAAMANITDRIFFGGVRDIWPTPFLAVKNNFADWVLFLTTLCILWFVQKEKSKII